MPIQVKLLENYAENRIHCDSILSKLPEWFGPHDVYKDYLDDLKTRSVYGVSVDGVVVGLMALTQTSIATLDIHLIAVTPEKHGIGIGRALVSHAKRVAREKDMSFLTVKTLGPSHKNDFYSRTHAFYSSIGFKPIEEYVDFWGEGFPMLLFCMSVK